MSEYGQQNVTEKDLANSGGSAPSQLVVANAHHQPPPTSGCYKLQAAATKWPPRNLRNATFGTQEPGDQSHILLLYRICTRGHHFHSAIFHSDHFHSAHFHVKRSKVILQRCYLYYLCHLHWFNQGERESILFCNWEPSGRRRGNNFQRLPGTSIRGFFIE